MKQIKEYEYGIIIYYRKEYYSELVFLSLLLCLLKIMKIYIYGCNEL